MLLRLFDGLSVSWITQVTFKIFNKIFLT